MSFFCVRNLVYQDKCFFTRKISIFANLNFSRIISLHTSCPASNLSCIQPVLHTSCHVYVLSCIDPVLLSHLLFPTCPTSVLSCIGPVLHPSCPAAFPPYILPVLQPSCPEAFLSCFCLHTSCPVENFFFLDFKITVMTYDFALLSQQFFLTLTNL